MPSVRVLEDHELMQGGRLGVRDGTIGVWRIFTN